MPSITQDIYEIPAPTVTEEEEIDFSKYFGPGKKKYINQ